MDRPLAWLAASILVLILWTGSSAVGLHLETVHHGGYGAVLAICLTRLAAMSLQDRKRLQQLGLETADTRDAIRAAALLIQKHGFDQQQRVLQDAALRHAELSQTGKHFYLAVLKPGEDISEED